MSFLEVRCRVRPQRVAILVSLRAGARTIEKAFDVLSWLWAGRHGMILCVGTAEANAQTLRWLTEKRPEVVFALALGRRESRWRRLAEESCQPHVFAALPAKSTLADLLRADPAQLPTAAEAAQHFVDQRLHERFKSVFWSVSSRNSLSVYVKAVYGMPWNYDVEDLARHFGGDPLRLSSESHLDLLRGFTSSVGRLCWHDVASHGMVPDVDGDVGLAMAPTVVVVSKIIPDLALYWNLRACLGSGAVSQVIPVPREMAFSEGTISALREWLLARSRNSTYVELTSYGATDLALNKFARRLRAGLRGLPLKHVLVHRRTPWGSSASAYERKLHIPIELSDDTPRVVSVRCPAPALSVAFKRKRRWCVDLEGEVRGGRALGEFATGGRKALIEVLRATFPTRGSYTRTPILGESAKGISLRAESPDEPIRFALPAPEEALETLLRAAGLTVGVDEKRSTYVEGIRILGGIEQASMILRGESLRILLALAEKERMTLPEIQEELRLGRRLRDQPKLPSRVLSMITRQPEHLRPFVKKRYAEHFQRRIHSSEASAGLFEKWVYHGIVSPQLRLGPCGRCASTYWASNQVEAREPVCVGCGERLRPGLVKGGFSINPLLKLAIAEGLVPVLLTASYLRRCSTRSFMWLPGVKGELNGLPYDVDVLAMCDGKLVLCECKGLVGVPANRFPQGVLEQFARLVDVGKACRGQVVLLASLAKRYPRRITEFARRSEGPTMSVRVLRRSALEDGVPRSTKGERVWGLNHLLPEPKRRRRRKRKKERRGKNAPVYESYLR